VEYQLECTEDAIFLCSDIQPSDLKDFRLKASCFKKESLHLILPQIVLFIFRLKNTLGVFLEFFTF